MTNAVDFIQLTHLLSTICAEVALPAAKQDNDRELRQMGASFVKWFLASTQSSILQSSQPQPENGTEPENGNQGIITE